MSATHVGGFNLSLVPLLQIQVVPDSYRTAISQVRQSDCEGPLQVKQVL